MLAYRLIAGINILKPSFCPKCYEQIVWYDNIPCISWIFLCGSCRFCQKRISILYPIIELLTAGILTVLSFSVPADYFPSYIIFFSALIITIRSDIETGYISRFVSLGLIPVGIISSLFQLLPISIYESIMGSISGYGFFWFINWLFKRFTGKNGLGEGDMDLMAGIGAMLGPVGVWFVMLFGSVLGSIIGIFLCIYKKCRTISLPFGPFLAIGAIIFTLYGPQIMSALFLIC